MKSINEIFSENLKHYVNRSGKQQQQIAHEIGVSKGTMSDWINGRSIPRMAKVEALAEHFGINKSDLLEEKVEENDYYLNIEVKEMAQELFDNKELRVLFSASRNLSKDDITAVTDIVKRLTKM